MQSTSLQFRQRVAGYIRPISWQLRVSFDKTFDAAVDFFTLDTSVLDGTDILSPSDDNPIQAWDQYAYLNYTDRVISLEVTREENEPFSVAQAYGDVIVNNYDSYFTPNSGSPIDPFILPRRPMRFYVGFGSETLQQLVGLTDGMPILDKASRTARFHVIDYLSYLLGKDITETIILQDVRTHEVIEYLLDFMGLSSDQYILDGSVNFIKFFYVEKGETFGSVINKLIEAEIGTFYLDELGFIRFKNRYNYSLTPVHTFDKSNTIDYSVADDVQIINSVKITGDVREVQASKSIGTANDIEVGAGDTVEFFITFNDPVTTATNPVYSATGIASSYFTSVLSSDGVTAYTSVSLTSLYLFSKAAKLTFHNTGGSDALITIVDLYGTPAEVVNPISISEIDQDSIDKFEEQIYTIDNEYIQDETNARTKATILLRDYKDYGSAVNLEVKGTPALQIDDPVVLDLDGFQGVYLIKKIVNIISGGQFRQELRALQKEIVTFFTLDESVLDGADLLGL